MDYFFYGTLMDPDVVARIAGGHRGPPPLEPAYAEGFARVYVAGVSYPILEKYLCQA